MVAMISSKDNLEQ